jgi:hypothetical protein
LEYGVILGLIVVGVVLATLLQDTNNANGKGRTFTINLGARTYGTQVAHIIDRQDTRSGTDSSLKQSPELTVVAASTGGTFEPTNNQRDVSNSSGQMSEGEARQAIVGLLKAYPKHFPVTKATVRTAAIVRHGDHIQIDGL